MTDAEMVKEERRAPLPAKRPTILRQGNQDDGDSMSVHAAAPSRPSPPLPGTRPPPSIPKLPAASAVAVHPKQSASASRESRTSNSSAKKRPEITIVDARPMSQIGFRDIQTQDKMTAVKPGMSENKPVNRITIAHNQETKLHHNLDTSIPAIPSRPPPLPTQTPVKPGSQHMQQAVVSKSSPPPVLPSRPASFCVSAIDRSDKNSAAITPVPSRPTILRPAKPKSIAAKNEKSTDASKEIPLPHITKPSSAVESDGLNLVDTNVPPPKPARVVHLTSSEVTEKNDPTTLAVVPEVPQKPVRTFIIRPIPKRKTSIKDVEKKSEQLQLETTDSSKVNEGLRAEPGKIPPPVPASSPHLANPRLGHPSEHSSSETELAQTAVPTELSKSKDVHETRYKPQTSEVNLNPPKKITVSNNSRKQENLHPTSPNSLHFNNHPPVRSPPAVPLNGDDNSLSTHLYEDVDIQANSIHEQEHKHFDNKSNESFKDSNDNEQDMEVMYAKINKDFISHPEPKSNSVNLSNPFGIKLKRTIPTTDDGNDKQISSEQLCDSAQSKNTTVMSPKPKPSVLPKPQPPLKPKTESSDLSSPSVPVQSYQANAAHSAQKSQNNVNCKQTIEMRRTTIIQPSKPAVSLEKVGTNTAQETETNCMKFDENKTLVSNSLQPASNVSTTVDDQPSELPVPKKRPTIIRLPSHNTKSDSDAKQPSHPIPKQRQSVSLTSVPDHRNKIELNEEKPFTKSHLSKEENLSSSSASRPPPPRPEHRPLKPCAGEPESKTCLDTDRPNAQAGIPVSLPPPHPISTPQPVKEYSLSLNPVTDVTSHVQSSEHLRQDKHKPPSRPSGPPPPRPVSMPPKFHERPAEDHGDNKGEKLVKPQPARPAAPQILKQSAPPPLPHRPGLTHPLYGYMMGEPHAIAIHDYQSRHEDEIAFQEGDIVVLLKRIDDQWLMGRVGDSEGIFPQTFVTIIHPLHEELPSFAIADVIDTEVLEESKEKPDKMTGPRCRARFDFDGEGHGDLTFEDGDVIELLSHCGNDWLKGRLNGKTGIFPASFVEIIEDLPDEVRKPDMDSKRMNETTALFDFDGEAGELSFQAGDSILVVSKINDQWLYGQCRGMEGSFPATFVDTLPAGLPLHSSTSVPKQSPTSPAPKCFCTALYDFEGQQEDDLSFQVGDEIEILENLGQDWLRGCLHGRKGLVPAAFVQIQPKSAAFVSEAELFLDSGTGPETHKSLVLGRALHDFVGEADNELTFKVGDEIVLGSLVSADSEWQWGELHGKRGLFPAAFVEMI